MVMENISGQMEARIREILSTESGMDMEFGQIKNKLRYFPAVIEWIKNRDLEFTNGLENKFIRVNLDKILDKDLVVSIR